MPGCKERIRHRTMVRCAVKHLPFGLIVELDRERNQNLGEQSRKWKVVSNRQ